MRLFSSVRDERRSLIVITMHNLNLAALYADYLLLLAEGEVVSAGEAQLLINETVLSKAYGDQPLLTPHFHRGIPQLSPWGPGELYES